MGVNASGPTRGTQLAPGPSSRRRPPTSGGARVRGRARASHARSHPARPAHNHAAYVRGRTVPVCVPLLTTRHRSRGTAADPSCLAPLAGRWPRPALREMTRPGHALARAARRFPSGRSGSAGCLCTEDGLGVFLEPSDGERTVHVRGSERCALARTKPRLADLFLAPRITPYSGVEWATPFLGRSLCGC